MLPATVRRVKAICGGDGKTVNGECYIKIQETYLMSILRDAGNGLTEDEANGIRPQEPQSLGRPPERPGSLDYLYAQQS